MSTPTDLRAVRALFHAPHRVLGALTGPSLVPRLTTRLPTPAPLATIVEVLRGRLIVANPCIAARLPATVGTLAQAALRRALDPDRAEAEPPPPAHDSASASRLFLGDARAAAAARRLRALLVALSDADREALGTRASWTAAALYEPTTLTVHLSDSLAPPTAPEPLPVAAAPRYRLALVVGRGARPSGWDSIDAAAQTARAVPWPADAEPLPWFIVRALVADAVAAHAMDAQTLARWAAVTGRGGPTSRDTYWFAETWERFRERTRPVGHVTPAEVARSRRRSMPSVEPEAEGSLAYALTPSIEQGVCVPPGYCLVDCVGTLEICVVAV